MIYGPRRDIMLAWPRWRHHPRLHICLAGPCFVQLQIHLTEICYGHCCLFDPLIQFCSPLEFLKPTFIVGNSSVTVTTTPSKLLQGFVPASTAKIKLNVPRTLVMMIVVGGRAFTFAEPQISLERVVAISALKDLNLALLPTAKEQIIHHLGLLAIIQHQSLT